MTYKYYIDQDLSSISNTDLRTEILIMEEELEMQQAKRLPYLENGLWYEGEEVSSAKQYLEVLEYEWLRRDALRTVKKFHQTCQNLN